ncbi:MAG: hypothetical protein ACN6PV_13750 [Achromobacter sp.]|uniref:hypothetical protein n=1 Tax=Achromobacter sp. TaxID=134375 RepID=UPI003D00E7A3
MNTEWKPIASAPKDGSSILGWGPQQDRVVIAWNEWAQPEPGWEAVGLEVNGFGCPEIVLRGEPTLWQSLPVEPCMTCGGHGMVGGLTQHSGYDAEPCPDCSPPAPTSHPIPTGATGERDWELSCDECNGSGHVFVKHQVAERKTDVQEFKEECECCDGRGFNIAFEDIPGIAEYVKSCRADAGETGEDDAPSYQWLTTVAQMKVLAAELTLAAETMGGDDDESAEIELILSAAKPGTVQDDDGASNTAPILTVHLAEYPEEGVYPIDPCDPTGGRIDSPAPAAGDALDADPLQGAANWLAQAHGQFSPLVLSACLMIGYNRASRLYDAAIAQQSQRKEA